jgi:hypothetical protein
METQIGTITHYYSHLSVAVLQLTERLVLGETIHIFGPITDFVQKVTSLEVNHQKVTMVEPCNYVAVKVMEPVRVHDAIYHVMRDVFDLQTL